ncbi:MAG: hypothetical protein DBX36_02805 [Oscillospiraceae bacterium]|nr:MAG: hypothetical protein DBX36_02805 [Oscillospiraceae bacterium]
MGVGSATPSSDMGGGNLSCSAAAFLPGRLTPKEINFRFKTDSQFYSILTGLRQLCLRQMLPLGSDKINHVLFF